MCPIIGSSPYRDVVQAHDRCPIRVTQESRPSRRHRPESEAVAIDSSDSPHPVVLRGGPLRLASSWAWHLRRTRPGLAQWRRCQAAPRKQPHEPPAHCGHGDPGAAGSLWAGASEARGAVTVVCGPVDDGPSLPTDSFQAFQVTSELSHSRSVPLAGRRHIMFAKSVRRSTEPVTTRRLPVAESVTVLQQAVENESHRLLRSSGAVTVFYFGRKTISSALGCNLPAA